MIGGQEFKEPSCQGFERIIYICIKITKSMLIIFSDLLHRITVRRKESIYVNA